MLIQKEEAAQGLDASLPTIAANGTHIGSVESVIMNGRKSNQAKPVSIEPVPTLDTKGGVWLAESTVLSHHSSGAPRTTDDHLPMITRGRAGAKKRESAPAMLIELFVLSHVSGGAHALISASYGANSTCTSEDDPLPTLTTKDRFGIVVPVTHSKSGMVPVTWLIRFRR